MWGETRKVFITSALRDLLAHDVDAVREFAAAEIARREADPRYEITVKHVGSEADPLVYDALVADEERARGNARRRARKALEAEGEQVTPEAVAERAGTDPQWKHDLGILTRAWILAGCIDGPETLRRLWALGEEQGGAPGASSLIVHAAIEVRRAQEVSAATGKR